MKHILYIPTGRPFLFFPERGKITGNYRDEDREVLLTWSAEQYANYQGETIETILTNVLLGRYRLESYQECSFCINR